MLRRERSKNGFYSGAHPSCKSAGALLEFATFLYLKPLETFSCPIPPTIAAAKAEISDASFSNSVASFKKIGSKKLFSGSIVTK